MGWMQLKKDEIDRRSNSGRLKKIKTKRNIPQYANILFGISPYIVNITFLATETVKQHKLN